MQRNVALAHSASLRRAVIAERAAALPAIVLALLIGAFMVAGAGLAGSDVIHNAAHDARHAMGFPCH